MSPTFSRKLAGLLIAVILASLSTAEAGQKIGDVRKKRTQDDNTFYSRMQVYGTIEHYDSDGAFERLDEQVEDITNQATAMFGSAEGDFEVTDGNGARLGVVYENFMGSKIDWGGSVSYVIGPEAEADLRYSNVIDHVDLDTRFLVFMLEGSRRFYLTEKMRFKLGGGVGFGQGKINFTETFRVTGVGQSTFSDAIDWWKLAYEANVGLGREMGYFYLEGGARYTQFPKNEHSDYFNLEFNWRPVSVYLSLYY